MAVSHSQYDMTALLLAYGADINASFDEDGANFPAAIAFALKDYRYPQWYIKIFYLNWGKNLRPTLPQSNTSRFEIKKCKRLDEARWFDCKTVF